jgi:hypothetical protein
MPKFRKKPIVIEAVQLRWNNWNEMCDHAGVGKISEGKPEGCWIGQDAQPIPDQNKPDCTKDRLGILIPTLEGLMIGIQGDWIIRGVKGEFYPIKNDIFLETYEKVD